MQTTEIYCLTSLGFNHATKGGGARTHDVILQMDVRSAVAQLVER